MKQPIRSVLNRTSRSDGPISRVHQEETRRAARPIRFVSQDDKADASTYKTEASALPIEGLQSILRTNLQTEASAQPITSIGRIIFGRTFFRWIIPQDGIVGSANHINRSNYLRTDFLRTDHLRTDFLRRIYKIGRTFRIGQSCRFSEESPFEDDPSEESLSEDNSTD